MRKYRSVQTILNISSSKRLTLDDLMDLIEIGIQPFDFGWYSIHLDIVCLEQGGLGEVGGGFA